ncbi:hypothetical protein QBC41DRAFT_351239 [Cercophora samala]|uniref:Cyanovirin-N domain-containing protein n=1 Tax=Cercophora samala TaxID=330535 RepID=A0AA39YUZ9_9PEZI|nr:hypothetical protein QBC41DRAFT_351239 [Cercophora samala]
MKFITPFTIGLAALSLPDTVLAAFPTGCRFWTTSGKYLLAQCWRNNGNELATRQDMNLCLANNNGELVPRNNGNAFNSCTWEIYHTDLGIVSYKCKKSNGSMGDEKAFDLRSVNIEVIDGYIWCFGHRSAPHAWSKREELLLEDRSSPKDE